MLPLLGYCTEYIFTDQNNKRIVLALQSGLKSELTWALNTLTLLSFKEKDDLRRDSTALAKIPGLLDALLQVVGARIFLFVDDWRDIAFPRDYTKLARVRTLGVNSVVTGFGNEFEATSGLDTTSHPGCVKMTFSWPTSHFRHSYISLYEKRAVQAIMGMLGSSVKAWHCAAAELLGRLIINPDNEPFLLPSAPEMYRRLVDLLSLPAVDAQAAAVGALYNLAEVNADCKVRLASERWAIDRLFKVVKTPHPVPDVCRKAAMILESLVSEPQNRHLLLAHESSFVEILMSDGRYSDTFARILYELTSRPNSKVSTTRGVWGM
ncbi:hypothetical protein GW17_00009641 [Ensete ventricosum]|nr:hypothetical protein GW17_00009641 [Ensete ventricosum]